MRTTAASGNASAPRTRGIHVDAARLLRRIDELGGIGRTPQGGVTRPAFSSEDREAQRYIRGEALAAGLHTRVDPAGNVIISRSSRPAPHPVVLMGSHLDTVINGGRLDGAYGVVAALEVLQTVVESGLRTEHEPVAVAFANEEGALFPQPFWGSMALSGQSARLPADPRDRHGNSLAEPLRRAGGDLEHLSHAAWPHEAIRAYLELHIEQGPVLEGLGVPIGVVTDIVGRAAFDVHIEGQAGHAGTTPMSRRQDAAVAASHVVLAAERMATTAGLCRVATAGRLALHPGATNVVPGSAYVSVELRDESEERLSGATAFFVDELASISGRTGCSVRAEEVLRTTPVPTDLRLRDVIASVAKDLGVEYASLPSGAGHDAQIMASVAPTGMIFVPSVNGLSHTPEEDTADDDLVTGAEVLLWAALSA